MKALTILVVLFFSSISLAQSPVEKHGQLKVEGNHLVNSKGEVVQLKGVGTHGLQWFGDFYKDGVAIKCAAKDWNAQVVRLTVYLYEEGYLDNPKLKPEDFDKMIFAIADSCIENGVYCIIDWHVHHPGFPSYYLKDAKIFFDKMAKRYAGVPNILYEIANEPNRTGYKDVEGHEVTWKEIKEYANEVIPVIRKHSPDSVVLVGTPAWSSLGQSAGRKWQEIGDDPLKKKNILYVVHFYAAGHNFYKAVDEAAKKLPLFVTEWASATWETDSKNDPKQTAVWLEVINRHKIGWTYWNFAPGNSVFSPFKEGAKPVRKDLEPQSDKISETGKLLFKLLNE
ncbi:MAG: glycoside hydrolase family 5 protein [Mariniblastus sp.]